VGKDILKKQKRLTKKTENQHQRTGYNFGFKLPRTVEEAFETDHNGENTIWYYAIQSEMKYILVAFKILHADIDTLNRY
jgi:hypothetical protein